MAKKSPKQAKNGFGNGRSNGLEQAMILLIQNQAAFVSQMSASNERFARIESELSEIKNILLRHESILLRHEDLLRKHEEILETLPETLAALPETIREKIGFKPRQ
jgi:hypothetical protein